MEVGKPEVCQRGFGLAVDVLALLQAGVAAAGNDDGQIVVLVGGAVAHAGAEGEDGVIEQGGAIGLLDFIQALQ